MWRVPGKGGKNISWFVLSYHSSFFPGRGCTRPAHNRYVVAVPPSLYCQFDNSPSQLSSLWSLRMDTGKTQTPNQHESDALTDRQRHRWMDEWKDDRQMNRQRDGWIDRWMDWWTDECMNGWKDEWIDEQIDRQTDGQTYQTTDWPTVWTINWLTGWPADGWTNGPTDGWIDR